MYSAFILPFSYEFCCRLAESTPKYDTLLFASREGYLFHKIFCLLYPERAKSAKYLHVSRTLLNRFRFANGIQCSEFSELRLEDFLERKLLLDRNFLKTSVSEEIMRKKIKEFDTNLYDELNLEEDLGWKYQSKIYHEYLFSLFKKKSAVLVDIGYSGSIQLAIKQLYDFSLEGRYAILTNGGVNNLSQHNLYAMGLVRHGVDWGELNILDQSIIFESILTAPHGTVIGINCNETGFDFHYGKHAWDDDDKLYFQSEVNEMCMDVLDLSTENIRFSDSQLLAYYDLYLAPHTRLFTISPRLTSVDDWSSQGTSKFESLSTLKLQSLDNFQDSSNVVIHMQSNGKLITFSSNFIKRNFPPKSKIYRISARIYKDIIMK